MNVVISFLLIYNHLKFILYWFVNMCFCLDECRLDFGVVVPYLHRPDDGVGSLRALRNKTLVLWRSSNRFLAAETPLKPQSDTFKLT